MKRFTKKALPLAIAAAMAPGFAIAADASGFVDIVYTMSDSHTGDPSSTEGKFAANAELDLVASPTDGVTVRVDIDFDLAVNGGANINNTDTDKVDSGRIEQAFFAWGAAEGVTVLGGVFNNPIGLEAEDAPDMWGTNHGVVYNILNHQTALNGNNIAGLAGAFAVGPATITVAYLNDIQQTNEENSFAFVANYSPLEGLGLEVGFVTQADQATSAGTSAEDVANFNVSYDTPLEGLSVALDYLAPSKIIDSAYEVMIDYSIGAFGVGVRAEAVAWESGADDTDRTTFHASYQVASNLIAILEVAEGSDDATPGSLIETVTGIEKGNLTTLELIATF